jgi:hypothetical protein
MFAFVSGPRFGRQAAIRLVLLAVLTAGFPFLVYGLIVATNARSVGGAAGAVAVVAGVYLKPIIFGAFLIAMLSPCWRRMRSLGLPAYWGLFVPFLFLMDGAFFIVAGAHWGVGFSLGILHVGVPYYAITAVVLIGAMSMAFPPSGDGAQGLERFGRIGVVARLLGIAIIVLTLVSWAAGGTFFAALMSASRHGARTVPSAPLVVMVALTYWTAAIRPFLCLALCGVVAWLTILSRRDDGSGNSGPRPLAPSPAPTLPRVEFGRR